MKPIMDSERVYALTKARPAMLASVSNLQRIEARPYALPPLAERGHGAVYIVGSGPSLVDGIDALRSAQASGALVYATNTSLPAMARAGIVPDVVVVREVLDVADQLSHGAHEIVCDLACSPRVWERAGWHPGIASWFVAGGTQFFALAHRLGVRPLFGGPASLTAAVALAIERGAGRIVLVGVDLAFADDGQGYASGTAYEGFAGQLTDAGMRVGGAGLEVMRAASAAASVPPPPRVQRTARVPSLDGREVEQLGTWADQQAWLESIATRFGERIELVNATARGALIAGWSRRPALTRRQPWPRVMRQAVALERVRDTVEDVRRQAETVASMADTVRDADGCVVAVPGYLEGCDIVEAVAAGDMITVREMGYAPGPGVRLTCMALSDAARAVREALPSVAVAAHTAAP